MLIKYVLVRIHWLLLLCNCSGPLPLYGNEPLDAPPTTEPRHVYMSSFNYANSGAPTNWWSNYMAEVA